ncbi:MAG: RNA polymerase sporulation sigma factor SigK [Oscillospiraceae bacterium]|nr:RNA polymerase sporulation sigma factor SigK [Oscillospiraceae bacterium]
MLYSALLLLLSGVFLTLRLGTGGSFPKPLSPEEERTAVEAWVERGDLAARNTLVEHNLRLVAHIIKKYFSQKADQEDLISIGTIGLIKGVSTYRPDRNVRLATYASRCIENEILMHFRSQKKSAGDVSLSERIDTDGDGNDLSLMDVLAEEADLAEDVSMAELCGQARRCVDTVLEPREAEIISLRYGLDGKKPLTQRETAEIAGISRSYVSRIEKKALEKLRRAIDG